MMWFQELKIFELVYANKLDPSKITRKMHNNKEVAYI